MRTTALLAACLFAVPARAEDKPVKQFVYKKTKQADLALSVHYPPDWKESDKRPVILFFFGGGWSQGTVKQFEPQAEYLAGRGLVAIRADYRVKSRHDVTPDQCVEDARSAVRWVRQNAAKLGIDPDKVIAAGGSAGGHLAACTGCCPGPDADGDDKKVSARANAMVLFNPVVRFDGVPSLMDRIGKDEKLGKLLSPTLHLAKDSPPALLLYGKKDKLLAQGEEYVKRAKEVGCTAELYLADDVGHSFFNRSPWRERTLKRVDEFLAGPGYLKGKPTVKEP
jgi:acetyl esterase/lipase